MSWWSRLKKGGIGAAIGGAIGLIGGPAGALVGASLGAGIGAGRSGPRAGAGEPPALANLSVTPEEAAARAAPLLQALEASAASQRPQVRGQTFAGFAERGFGLSGLAEEGVARALAGFDADIATKRANILSGAATDIFGERQALNQQAQEAERNRLERESKRRDFLGIRF